jgi:hypothetical protein
VVWTFLIVYYNSDDEILSIISRYVIYLFLFGGGGYYLYLYFSHSNARFEVNVYNISILVAIIAAVLNVLSYFYINKKEPNWLKVIFIALSSLMTLFIALITIYTLFTWTPPTIVENIVYFLK